MLFLAAIFDAKWLGRGPSFGWSIVVGPSCGMPEIEGNLFLAIQN